MSVRYSVIRSLLVTLDLLYPTSSLLKLKLRLVLKKDSSSFGARVSVIENLAGIYNLCLIPPFRIETVRGRTLHY